MPTIKGLLEGKEIIQRMIDEKIEAFLKVLDECGGYAPTISDVKKFGGGRDSIGRVELSNGKIIALFCENYFRGNSDPYSVSFPAELIDTLSKEKIQKFVDETNKAKRDAEVKKEMDRKAQKDAEDRAQYEKLKAQFSRKVT